MVDESSSAAPAPDQPSDDAEGARCPWCSAPLPSPDVAECPSCRAHLVAPDGVTVPGVTVLDTSTIVAGSMNPKAPRMSLGMLIGTGDEDGAPTDAELSAVAHPDADVRREMLRMELAARLSDLEKEARLIQADRAAETPTAEAPTAASADDDAAPPPPAPDDPGQAAPGDPGQAAPGDSAEEPTSS